MKKPILLSLVTIGFLSLIFIVSASGAPGGRRIHYSTLFNPKTVGAISGEVMRVEQVPSGNGQDLCVQGVLKTSKGQITVVLGPKSYLAKRGLTLAPKDRLTVTGSSISIMGKPFLLATEVKGDRTMKLREASGRPVWAVGDDWHIQ
jgi:hypothetical protein